MTTPTAAPSDIVLNGSRVASGADTLAALVAEQGFAGLKIATAVNGDFVPERRRETTRLNPGDRVEILSVRQGG